LFSLDSIVIFIIVWWIVFFVFLPLGISKEKNVIPGNDPGAPSNANLKLKIIFTTVCTLFLTIIISFLKNEIF